MRRIFLGCLVGLVALFGLHGAQAEDERPEAPRRDPRCLRFADLVTRMVTEDKLERLRSGERGLDPDPWLLSWVLVAQGKPEVARVLVRECACPELARLPDRIEAWAAAPPGAERLAHVVALERGIDRYVLRLDETLEAGGLLIEQGRPFVRALALVRTGDALRRLGRHEEARRRLILAEAACAELGWTWGQDQAEHQRGKLALQAHRPREALTTLAAVVERRETLGWKRARGHAYTDLAAAHGVIGEYRDVLAWSTKAQSLLHPRWDFHALFEVHANKANAFALIGDLAGALFEYEEAASLADAFEHAQRQSRAHVHVAWLQARLGRFDAADRSVRRAATHAAGLPAAEDGLPHPEAVLVDAFGGGIAGLRAQGSSDDGDWARAFAAHARAYETFAAREERHLAAKALLAQATVRAWQARHADALALLGKAHEAFTSLEDEASMIEARLLEGWIRLAQDDATTAATAFADAWTRAKAIELLHAQAIALHGRAAARATGVDARQGKARAEVQRAILEDVEAAVGIHARLASGLAEEQVAAAREGFAVTPLGQDASARSDLFALGLRTAAALGDPARLLQLIESGRALGFLEAHSGMAALRAAGAADLVGEEERLARREEALARFALERARRRRRRRKIQAAQDTLREAMANTAAVLERAQRRAKARANAVYPAPADIASIQAALGPRDRLVSFAVFDDAVHAVVVAAEGAPSTLRLAALEPVTTAVRTLHEGVEAKSEASRAALDRLRTLLVVPLGDITSTRRLLISPDGALHGVPFPAILPTCEVTQIPSASAWLALRRADAETASGILGIGAPVYTQARGLQPLEGAAAELSALPGKDVRRLVGPAATRAGLLAALPAPGARLTVLHIACHGIADELHPSASALELSADRTHDGTWRAQDIMLARVPASLVVLSACETGLGRTYRGEGLLGLPRAFLIAGADRVMASLWRADDAATRALMGHFHRARAAGASAAAALCSAQAAVRAETRWRHPYYWAGWVLWGRGG